MTHLGGPTAVQLLVLDAATHNVLSADITAETVVIGSASNTVTLNCLGPTMLSGANSANKLQVLDSTVESIFNINTSTKVITTFVNTLDDGLGGATFVVGNITGNLLIVGDDMINKLNVMNFVGSVIFQVDTLSNIVSTLVNTMDDGSGGIFITAMNFNGTSAQIKGTTYSGTNIAFTFADTGSDLTGTLNVIPNYDGRIPGPASAVVTYDIPDVGLHFFWDNVEVGGTFMVDSTSIFTGITDNGTTLLTTLTFPTGAQVTDTLGDIAPTAVITLSGSALGTNATPWDGIYLTNTPVIVSDFRKKSNVVDCSLGLDFVRGLRPVTYQIGKSERHNCGLIAQEVEALLTSLGHENLIVHNNKDTYGLAYDELIAPLIKSVQQLSDELEQFKTLFGITSK